MSLFSLNQRYDVIITLRIDYRFVLIRIVSQVSDMAQRPLFDISVRQMYR